MTVDAPKPPVAWDGHSYAICLPYPPGEPKHGWMEVSVKPQVTYVVRVRELGAEEWLIGIETPLTSCSFIVLKPAPNYEMELRAKNAAGERERTVVTCRTGPEGSVKPIPMSDAWNELAALVCSLEVELMPTVLGAHVSWQPDPPESRTAIIMPWPPSISQSAETAAIEEFARGLEGRVPSRTVVDMARRLVAAAISMTDEPEITVDVDGALAFDLRLNSGRLMFAELSIEGTLTFLSSTTVERKPS